MDKLINFVFTILMAMTGAICLEALQGTAIGDGMYLYWFGIVASIMGLTAQGTMIVAELRDEYIDDNQYPF
jgi:hypothetical protein